MKLPLSLPFSFFLSIPLTLLFCLTSTALADELSDEDLADVAGNYAFVQQLDPTATFCDEEGYRVTYDSRAKTLELRFESKGLNFVRYAFHHINGKTWREKSNGTNPKNPFPSLGYREEKVSTSGGIVHKDARGCDGIWPFVRCSDYRNFEQIEITPDGGLIVYGISVYDRPNPLLIKWCEYKKE